MPANFKEENGIIELTIEGFVTLEDGMQMQDGVQKILETSDSERVIVDITKMSHDYKTHEIIQIFSRIPEIFPPHVKHAIVFSPESHPIKTAEFSENFSFNRNIQVRLFEDRNEAETWLNSL